MKKVFIGFGLVFLMVLVAVAITTTGDRDDIKNGVGTVPLDDALPGEVTFEPPDLFANALPLESWVSGDVGAQFIAGHGAVLDVWSFWVSGYSEPNALAFNSSSHNADGSIPRLPAIIKFDPPVEFVSLKVATGVYIGWTAKIKAYSTSLSKIDDDSVSLASTTKTLSVASGTKNIELLLILGPSIMVVDDLIFY